MLFVGTIDNWLRPILISREVELPFVLMCSHSNVDCSGVFLAMRQQFNKLGSIVLSREIGTTLEKELNEKSSLKTLKQIIKFSKVK